MTFILISDRMQMQVTVSSADCYDVTDIFFLRLAKQIFVF